MSSRGLQGLISDNMKLPRTLLKCSKVKQYYMYLLLKHLEVKIDNSLILAVRPFIHNFVCYVTLFAIT